MVLRWSQFDNQVKDAKQNWAKWSSQLGASRHIGEWGLWLRPKRKYVVFPVTRPTLVFRSDPNVSSLFRKWKYCFPSPDPVGRKTVKIGRKMAEIGTKKKIVRKWPIFVVINLFLTKPHSWQQAPGQDSVDNALALEACMTHDYDCVRK